MSGFKDEKELWKFQRRRLRGKWDRYELITPAGHPDVKGSFEHQIIYIENKVGEPKVSALEGAQTAYIEWLRQCAQIVYVCFGSKSKDEVTWWTYDDKRLYRAVPPRFWNPSPIRR